MTAAFDQVALGGGTPKLLYTSPSFVSSSATGVEGYQLIGSNDSVVVFEFYSEPFTNGLLDPTKATATFTPCRLEPATTTPTTLANYTAGNQLPLVFLAAPSGSGYPGNVLFATVEHSTGTFPLLTITFSAVSIPLNGGTAPAPIANSAYSPLAIISAHSHRQRMAGDRHYGHKWRLWRRHCQFRECQQSDGYAVHHHRRRGLCFFARLCRRASSRSQATTLPSGFLDNAGRHPGYWLRCRRTALRPT